MTTPLTEAELSALASAATKAWLSNPEAHLIRQAVAELRAARAPLPQDPGQGDLVERLRAIESFRNMYGEMIAVFEASLLPEIIQALSQPRDVPEPVAWRVKDFADGWFFYGLDQYAEALRAECDGARVEPLYALSARPTPGVSGKQEVSSARGASDGRGTTASPPDGPHSAGKWRKRPVVVEAVQIVTRADANNTRGVCTGGLGCPGSGPEGAWPHVHTPSRRRAGTFHREPR